MIKLKADKDYDPQDSVHFPPERHTEFYKTCKKLVGKYGDRIINLYTSPDLRFKIFHELKCTSTNAFIITKLMQDNTYSTTCLNGSKMFKIELDNHFMKGLNIGMRTFIDFGYFHSVFMFTEDTLRRMLRILDLNACNKGTAEFKNIYECLLKKINLQKYSKLLDVCRLIRNSIHSNGEYNHKSFVDANIVYKKKKFIFKIGKPIRFDEWNFVDKYDFFVFLLNEICEMFEKIIESKMIKTIPNKELV